MSFVDRFLGFFEKRISPFPEEPPSRPPGKLVPFLWHYTRDSWVWLLLMGLLSALISVLEISLFSFLGNLVDWLGNRDPATLLSEESGRLAWMALVILVLLPLASFTHSLLLHQTIIGNFVMSVRWKAHRWMLGQSYSFYQDEFAGRVATKVMQTSLAIRDAVLKILDVLVYVGVYFIGAMVLVSSFSVWMMLPFIIWLVLYVLMLRNFMPRLKQISRSQADARSEMTGRVVDSYTNIMTVKLFAHAGHEASYARSSMQTFLGTVHPQFRMVTGLDICLNTLNALLLFSVGSAGLLLWVNGQTGVGALAVGVGLVLRLQGMSNWIMWELSGLFESVGIIYDGMQMLSTRQEIVDKPEADDLDVPAGRIQFEAVGFHYGRDAGIIEALNLDIRGGEKIGLVGRSGAGKTTLTNLLLRLYEVESGRILIDGMDITSVRQESLRQHIGVVTQDTSLLHRSVYENIAYGRRDASRDEVEAAARRANAHDFILDLEDTSGRKGYEAQVGERGVKLSGGQRQRLAIARMFLKDAPILVLDEATSALDSEVEAVIQENLSALMDGKTVIAIAHRLSTIAAMDRLIVMDAGAVVQEGSHTELSTGEGLYAQLWARQSGGFLDLPEVSAEGDNIS
ncbi:ABC transporter ATP-binding protein [Granulosicoccus antarcticus]|uniref:Multidrug export ATP-binding/permease protein n=1 Tax=Granulosicoccus antarcticus IMCC3135 TaxID=1192854 RepID=A0A2Z2NRN2_9GAMM|nr:ABC transporter ATP-binding protein [Granulosicoccus antarcticus]ASJ71400.1 Putative multidrug export ATP-binding/permease protein [Granulosicoccus antarcticus IMCC3135]